MSYEVGSWYEQSGSVYVYINSHGTVEHFHAVKWYKILFLAILQFFGKKKHIQEVREFLSD